MFFDGELPNIFIPNFSTGEISNSRMMFYCQKHLTKVRSLVFFSVFLEYPKPFSFVSGTLNTNIPRFLHDYNTFSVYNVEGEKVKQRFI